jgi:thiol-disulfide isomerase/thioredoxin
LAAGLLMLVAFAVQALPLIGEPAPALKGKLFNGEAFDLARLRGKVVLVNFYSSYCKFCAYEIGVLESFYEEHRNEGFEVIVVGVDARTVPASSACSASTTFRVRWPTS